MLKKIISLMKKLGFKKAEGQYRQDSIRLQSVPGQQDREASRQKLKLRFKKYFLKKKNSKYSHVNYNKPAESKKSIWRKSVVVGICLTVFLLVGLFSVPGRLVGHLESLSFFSVSQISSSGCRLVSEEKLREVSGIIPYQTNLLSLDCSAVEKRLSSIPWIASAVVTRNWPSTVEISVVENIPVALLHNSDSEMSQLHYVDSDGKPFLAASPGADIDFPVITGLMEISNTQLRERALEEVMIFLKRIGKNHPYLPAQSVSEVHLNKRGQLVVYLTEYPFPIFFGEGDTKSKYSKLIQVLKALYVKQEGRESISNIKYIQMDYLNNKVLVAESGSS